VTAELWLALAGYAFATAVTPGPNNMMLMAVGLNHGLRRTMAPLLGLNAGFMLLLLAVGAGLGGLFAAFPWMHGLLKVGGAAYLLWIAWKIATVPVGGTAEAAGPPIGFLGAAAFQWVNPKAWIMCIGAVAAYAPPEGYVANLAIVAGTYLLVGLPSNLVWALGGGALRGLVGRPARMRAFNVAMGALLAASVVPVLLL